MGVGSHTSGVQHHQTSRRFSTGWVPANKGPVARRDEGGREPSPRVAGAHIEAAHLDGCDDVDAPSLGQLHKGLIELCHVRLDHPALLAHHLSKKERTGLTDAWSVM